MNNRSNTRTKVIIYAMGVIALIVILRLFQLQIVLGKEYKESTSKDKFVNTAPSNRGYIYDANHAVLAAPGDDYFVGLNLFLMDEDDLKSISSDLAAILGIPYSNILAPFQFDSDGKLLPEYTEEEPFKGETIGPYHGLHYALAKDDQLPRISPEIADQILAMDIDKDGEPRGFINLEETPRRYFPENNLLCHTLGYVNFDNQGEIGLESYYQDELEGSNFTVWDRNTPLDAPAEFDSQESANIVLTIDRMVQLTVERHLREALETFEAPSGTIIVMDPRTGAILANANLPCFSPFDYYDKKHSDFLIDPSISQVYAPGSTFKLITMAAGIETGVITPQTEYSDSGFYEIADTTIKNAQGLVYWDITMTEALKHSVNTATTHVAVSMGAERFYTFMDRFGLTHALGIDLAHEAGGLMRQPGDSLWTKSDLATNAFGQGMSITPMQLISAVSALANGGQQMVPYVVEYIEYADRIEAHTPTVLNNPITEQTANQITAMAIESVGPGRLAGYTVAGKTGTAQISLQGGGFEEVDTIQSYIGWLPADAPEIVILVKLDRPQASEWGSQSAAPTFSKLAEELVILLDIEPDSSRLDG